jgi:flagellar motor switch protein FliN/FliY
MDSGAPIGWLTAECARRFADAIAGMAGKTPQIAAQAADDPSPEMLWWEQPFSGVGDAVLWVGARPATWNRIGAEALSGAGIENARAEDCRATYLELVHQTVAGLAGALTARLGTEVLPGNGEERAAPGEGAANQIALHFEDGAANRIVFVWSPAFGAALRPVLNAPPLLSPAAKPDRYELLLDVELPVSVSFGRAILPLREVLKLTSGAIVELNRAVSEPVELVVNNCVVARGEVVVVDGNYGVRVKQIISRNERLRTLH